MSFDYPDIGEREIIKRVLQKHGFTEFFGDDAVSVHFRKGNIIFHFTKDKRITSSILEYIVQTSKIPKQKFLHEYFVLEDEV